MCSTYHLRLNNSIFDTFNSICYLVMREFYRHCLLNRYNSIIYLISRHCILYPLIMDIYLTQDNSCVCKRGEKHLKLSILHNSLFMRFQEPQVRPGAIKVALLRKIGSDAQRVGTLAKGMISTRGQR